MHNFVAISVITIYAYPRILFITQNTTLIESFAIYFTLNFSHVWTRLELHIWSVYYANYVDPFTIF